MVCSCGSSFCDCDGKCICDREFCNCAACHLLWNRICKQCGQECLCLELPESNNDSNCHCSGASFEGINFKKLPELDFLKNKIDYTNTSGYAAGRNDSEADSETSLDKSISQADELFFHTDGTDSSPDKNLEIKNLLELYPDSQCNRSPVPSLKTSYHGESESVSEYRLYNLPQFVRAHHRSHSSPSSESTASPHSSTDSPPCPNRPTSVPDINTEGISPRQSRAESALPKAGSSSTAGKRQTFRRKIQFPASTSGYIPMRSENSASSSSSAASVTPERNICKLMNKLSISDTPKETDNLLSKMRGRDSSSSPEHQPTVTSRKETSTKTDIHRNQF